MLIVTMAMMIVIAAVEGHEMIKKTQHEGVLEKIFDAEKRVKDFFGGLSSSASSAVQRRGFNAQQSLSNFGPLCDASAVQQLINACPHVEGETTCSATCAAALNAASKRTQQCASVFATDRPWQYLAVRCQTIGGSSCATTLNRLADPEPSFNCASQSVSNCDHTRCLVYNGECRDRVTDATLQLMCTPCVNAVSQELTAAAASLKLASDKTNGMQRYQIAKYASDVVEFQAALDVLCAKANGNTFCTPIMQDLDAAFAQRYTTTRYTQVCEEYTPISICAQKVENVRYTWNVENTAVQYQECSAERTKFETPVPAPTPAPTTAAPTTTAAGATTTTAAGATTTTAAGATTTTAAGATTTTAAGATTTTAAGATTTTAAGATTTTAAATTTTTAAPTPAPTRVPATPRPTVSPAASCDAKFAFNAQQLLREAYTAVRCERRATGYCQLIQHQESINATVRQCVGASGQTCSAACDHDLLASVNRLDCCAKNVNITENIEQFFRNCPNTVARLRQLITAGECPVTRGTEVIPKALALPIRWSRIADDVNLRNKFRNSCVADVAANLGIDLTAIIDPALERDPTNTVNVPTSSSARRLLQATEAGSRFNFKLQAASNSITQGASALLDQLARQGISFSQTANLVALECPTCADPQALMTVRAPQPSGAATTIASILVALLAVILTL
jgi:hypothetical protein